MCSPSVPSYGQTAAQGQATANTQQTQFNDPSAAAAQQTSNYNAGGPFGSLQYIQTGVNPQTGMPTYTTQQGLSGPEANIFGGNMAGQAEVAGGMPSVLQGAYNGPNNIYGNTGSITNANMDLIFNSMAPWEKAQRSQLDDALRTQGILPGNVGTGGTAGTAYDQQMNQLDQSQIQAAGATAAAVEPQAYSQALSMYQTPLNTAMQGAAYGAMMPGVLPSQEAVGGAANTLQPANDIQSTANAQQFATAQYQAQMAQQSALLAGLFGAAGTVGGGWAKGGFQT